MSEKHTPGEWTTGDEIHEFNGGSLWRVPVWANDAEPGDKIVAEATARNREQARASAVLISAAPELLKALRNLLAADAAVMTPQESVPPALLEKRGYTVLAAEAAIAKAIGKAVQA